MIFILFMQLSGVHPDTVWKVEYKHVLEGLDLMNLNIRDLEFDKQWFSDSFRLKAVSDLMNHPLLVPDYVLVSGKKVRECRGLEDFFSFTCEEITGRKTTPESFDWHNLEDLVKEIYTKTQKHLDRAFARLTPEEIDSLIYTAPSLWSDEADSLTRGYAGALHKEFGVERDTGYTLDLVPLLQIAKEVDVAELHVAGATLARGVELVSSLARTLPKDAELPSRQVNGVTGAVHYLYELPGGGCCVVGGRGPNTYTEDFAFIIDLGGNDIYEGRVAGAVGKYGTPVSFVLDLSGDDVYRNDKRLVNQGAALFGAAMLWDLSGNDVYSAFHISHGAGLFGTGMLVDSNGIDSYRDGYFAQGAGNFGSGILVDLQGDDTYRSFSWTQGMGGVWGYGLLFDHEGDDLYYAGGEYLHMPLDPDQYRSFAQGFGMGWRDVASGGIGFLYDVTGNDKYISEVYGQATSYWFALGMLLDEYGNDLYTAAQYSQGAGIHLSVGGLIDMEGDDHYFSRFGPSQGEGHDLAVGWLLDKDGNDVYYASGGQGIGLNTSVGIFVDSRGNDDYCSREGMSQGGANWDRGTCGVGLFLDLQGDDRYAEKDKGKNDHVWTSGTYALGMDLEAVEPKKEEWEDTITVFPELDTIKSDSAKMARLFHYASLWEVCADIPKVKTARRMLNKDFGPKAVEYIYNNEMRTFDGLKLRAIEYAFKEYKDTAAYYLYQGLHAANDTVIRIAIYLFGQLEFTRAKDTLRIMLENEPVDKIVGMLITTLGKLKDTVAIPVIGRYSSHKSERMRLRVAIALQDIKDTLGLATLIRQLSDPCYLVKVAAIAGISSLGRKSLDGLKIELKKAGSDQYRAVLTKTMCKTYSQLEASAKTAELKKELAELVKGYLHSEHPALRDEVRRLIDEVEGRGSLKPDELFQLPEVFDE